MALPQVGYQALRKGRVSEVGRLYFITKSTRERLLKDATPDEQLQQGRLVQVGVPEIIMEALGWIQKQGLIRLWAYCLMPDHLHLLLQLGEKTGLDKVMKRFGSFTGLEVYKQTG